jgi:hypothetical protein
MISSPCYAAAKTYRVEVSGWDQNQAFFVEKSKLQLSEASGKYIELTSAIPDGAVVFLRLLPRLGVHRSDPMGYQTEFVETTPEGRHQFRLHPVCPRANRSCVSEPTVTIH